MSFEPRLRTDILSEDLTTELGSIQVIVESQFKRIVDNAEKMDRRTRTPGPAKSILEVYELIKQAVEDHDRRTNVNADAQVLFTYENPVHEGQLEAISVSLVSRQPGVYGRVSLKTRDQNSKPRNCRPILRELIDDPDAPGYKRAILGYFYDNTIRLTCWARTNKTANARMIWLESIMEEYSWYFVFSGVNRILYDGVGEDKEKVINNNPVYGRSIEYFVRTEKIRAVSQKKLEEICITLAADTSIST